MKVSGHMSLVELERLERAEREAAQARRLRIVILAIKGYTAPAIAMSPGLSRRVCQQWVYRYNESGLDGLEDRRGRSPGSPLTPEQQERVCQRIDSGPTAADEVSTLRGRDFQRILAEEFGLLRSLAGVYHLRHRLGYSCLRPRPRPRKAEAQKQQEFLRELPGRLAAIAAARPDKRLRVSFEAAGLFRGRGPLRPAGDGHHRVGQTRQSTHRRAADRVRLPGGAGSRLPRNGSCQRAAGAGEHLGPATAVLQPGTEPDREPVALSQKPLLE